MSIKEKIGILTFHNADNYGSVLQAYAIQKIVSRISTKETEIINYIPDGQEEMYKIFLKNSNCKYVIANLLSLLKYSILKSKKRNFESFRLRFLNIKKESSNNKINYQGYMTIITGSDQIWNIKVKDHSDIYFLKNINNIKKISYAPSFGGNQDLDISNYINSLKDYSSISVRELSGRNLIKKYLGIEVPVLLDPTLLIENNEWLKITSPRLIDKDYILFYSIDYNNDAINIARYISKKLNLKVITLFTSRQTYKVYFNGFKICKYTKPEDYLSLIKYASLVLTTSFHGLVFSILFKNNFYVVRGTYEGKINTDDRQTTLLNKLNLQDREIDINNYVNINLSSIIDYENIELLLQNERNKSLEFLESALQ